MLKPRRPYGALIQSLSKVWRIKGIEDERAFIHSGKAALPYFDEKLLRVACWNLCKGSGGYQFEHDFRSICRRNDLVLTQEALLSPRALKLFREDGFLMTHAASYERIDGMRDGVMTVSRAPFDTAYLRRIVCKHPEPVMNTPKVALVQKFFLGPLSETLLVINIHATLIRSVKIAIDELSHVLKFLPEHEGPIIFAGDFNSFSSGYLQAIERKLASIGLVRVIIPDDPRPKTQALDQIFVRGLRVLKSSVEVSYLNSDHFPVFATLSLA